PMTERPGTNRGGEPGPVDPPRSPIREEPSVLRVADLNRMLRGAVEEAFDRAVWVEGEVVGARAAASGHAYFSLKDEAEDATIDCVVYKSNLSPRARTLLTDGARVRLRGRPTFWAPRGRLQLVG